MAWKIKPEQRTLFDQTLKGEMGYLISSPLTMTYDVKAIGDFGVSRPKV